MVRESSQLYVFHCVMMRTPKDKREGEGDAYHDDITIQVLANVDIAFLNRVERGLMNTTLLDTEQARLKQSFGCPEALIADRDHLSVRELVGFLDTGTLSGGFDLLVEV